MKKQLLLFVMLLLPFVAWASAVEIGGIYYNLVEISKVAEVSRKPSGQYHWAILIPEKVTYEGTEYKVTSIGSCAFEGCSNLTYVKIPNSVTSIGRGAFCWCDILSSVVIPKSVTSIGYGAFQFCSGLTSVSIANSVTSIEDYAFQGCSGLTSVVIPNSVTSIGRWTFGSCYGLTSVTIGSGIKSISSAAFAACKNLEDVYCYAETVPSTQTSAFYNTLIENSKLHVSAASINAYKANEPWNSFGEILPISGVGIQEVSDRNMLIQSRDGVLTVDGADDGTQVNVYTIDGRQAGSAVSRNGQATVSPKLQPGSVAIIKVVIK